MAEHVPLGSYHVALPAPAWLPVNDLAGDPLKPFLRCRCQRVVRLTAYQVDTDGTVRPQFRHPRAPQFNDGTWGCGWAADLVLDGWQGPEFPGCPENVLKV